MTNKDAVVDFLMDSCDDDIITPEQYKKMRLILEGWPSNDDCKDDHIQIEVEEDIQDKIDELEK